MQQLAARAPFAAPAPTPIRFLRRFALVVVGGIFLVAALLKVLIFHNFAESTATFLGIGAPLNYIAAALVLATEAVTGAALLAGRRVRLFTAVAAGLLSLFVIVLAHAALTGLTAKCNCFGTTSINFGYRTQIGIDLVLIALALLARRATPPEGAAG